MLFSLSRKKVRVEIKLKDALAQKDGNCSAPLQITIRGAEVFGKQGRMSWKQGRQMMDAAPSVRSMNHCHLHRFQSSCKTYVCAREDRKKL
ncbi:hypothetical protein CDAR_373431 [Caerostris darwini]|uniref:Uncharacterized protein n=1 Tax=Caerostris darwini TaxID=1538125 RepID=A0AAV4N0B2_9ARAC|nr:hypothetical protein CDAR_373431 [Caerostris darwini]